MCYIDFPTPYSGRPIYPYHPCVEPWQVDPRLRYPTPIYPPTIIVREDSRVADLERRIKELEKKLAEQEEK